MVRNQSSSIRIRGRGPTADAYSLLSTLDRWKSIASIASAVAIPFVLAIAGYFIQKQLADEGLKKDYVSIAAGILKENPTGQEPDLRKWAVEVLERNSPIPFSQNAKRSLEQGIPIVLPGPALPQPIERCMESPKKRIVNAALERLSKDIEGAKKRGADVKVVLDHFMRFLDIVVEQESAAGKTDAALTCMQSWAKIIVKVDNEYRKSIGAPDSKSVYENLRKEQAAVRPAAGAASVVK